EPEQPAALRWHRASPSNPPRGAATERARATRRAAPPPLPRFAIRGVYVSNTLPICWRSPRGRCPSCAPTRRTYSSHSYHYWIRTPRERYAVESARGECGPRRTWKVRPAEEGAALGGRCGPRRTWKVRPSEDLEGAARGVPAESAAC